MCSVCLFPWCKYSYCGKFQATNVTTACTLPENSVLSPCKLVHVVQQNPGPQCVIIVVMRAGK